MHFFILLKVIIAKEHNLVPNSIENGNKDEMRYARSKKSNPSKNLYDDSFYDFNDTEGLSNDSSMEGSQEDASSKEPDQGSLNDDYFLLPEDTKDCKNESDISQKLNFEDEINQLDEKNKIYEDISKRILDLPRTSSDMNQKRHQK
jgi:hypothetical protein